jgi:hypothetical protein
MLGKLKAAGQSFFMTPEAFVLPLFLCLFLAYLKTLCGTVYLDDSGETISIATLLGIGHPPGYPLHTLMGRLACLVLPGSAAFGINLFSAFLGALAASSLFLLILRFQISKESKAAVWPALLVALAYGLGPVFFHQALVAKGSVYHLNNLLSILILMCLLPGCMPARFSQKLFWLLLGLALSHHYMSQIVLMPAYALLYFKRWNRAKHPLVPDGSKSWLILPGLSIYAYLPLRSALEPAINWSSISSLNDFIFHFSRAQYSSGEGARSLWAFMRQILEILRLIGIEGHGLLSAAALAGLWLAFRRKHALRWFSLLAILGPVVLAATYFNLEPERYYIFMPHLFPAYLGQCLAAGLGLNLLTQAWDHKKARLCLGLAALLPLGLGLGRMPSLNLSHWHYALDNARAMLMCAPRNAVVFISGDALVFPLWYLQHARGVRPDVSAVGVPVLPMTWVRNDLKKRFPNLQMPQVREPIGAESTNSIVLAMLTLNYGNLPLFFAHNKPEPDSIRGFSMMPYGLLYQPILSAAPVPAPAVSSASLFTAVSLRGMRPLPKDPATERLFSRDWAIHRNGHGLWAEEHGDFAASYAWYRQAHWVNPNDADLAYNVGNAAFYMKNIDEAMVWYRASIAIDPKYANAWFNLGVTLYNAGRSAEGQACMEKVLEIDPKRDDARGILRK